MVPPTPKRVAQNERVLVIFPGALGDLICLGPALRVLARRHHGATLELMAREELARFAVDRIGIPRIGSSRIGIARSHSRALSGAHSIDRREVAALFAEDPDLTEAARLFRPFTRIYSFFASDDAHFRRALEAVAMPGAVSFHAFRPIVSGHVAAGYLDAICERGAPTDEYLDAHVDVLADDIAEATQALARLGLGYARVVLLFPGSGSPYKNWPAENFVALANALATPLRALVVQGPAESTLEPLFIARGTARLRDQPLGTIAGLARLAAGFVGNDSGVSHLAAAAGAPGVAIFGSTDPDRWRPLGRVRVVQALKLADLTSAEVAAALKEMTAVS